MPTDATIELRPRTAGEILDDAWRLALAEAPLLLALSGLFAVPAAVALLLVLTRPVSDSVAGHLALPALAAVLLPLTGLGSGACQELFRRRAAGERVTLGACLRAALRRGPQHAGGRALTLLGVGPGSLVLVLPGLALWASLGTLHPALAVGDGRLFAALGDSARDARRQPAKASAVVLSRLPLLLLAAVNLYLLVAVVLWVAGEPAGLDVAVPDLLLSGGNPVYDVALVALAWLALAPYFEASSFLLHLDSRVRYDGLDLAYRVRTLFPAPERGRVAGVVLALAGLLLCAAPARAEPGAVPRRSREEIKKLAGTDDARDSARSKAPAEKQQKDKVRKDDPVEDAPERHPGGGGGGAVGPRAGGAGLGSSGWLVLGLLALAVLTGALVLFLRSRDPSAPVRAPETEALPSPNTAALEPDEQTPGDLWRRAEELARRGDFLEGVRHLYLAVLALLHRADLIRYEKSRTNGEYLRQLRAGDGGRAVADPFGRLTRLFEQKWYGERACAADDYDSCQELASQVRDGAREK